jgi:hypothetical protein
VEGTHELLMLLFFHQSETVRFLALLLPNSYSVIHAFNCSETLGQHKLSVVPVLCWFRKFLLTNKGNVLSILYDIVLLVSCFSVGFLPTVF